VRGALRAVVLSCCRARGHCAWLMVVVIFWFAEQPHSDEDAGPEVSAPSTAPPSRHASSTDVAAQLTDTSPPPNAVTADADVMPDVDANAGDESGACSMCAPLHLDARHSRRGLPSQMFTLACVVLAAPVSEVPADDVSANPEASTLHSQTAEADNVPVPSPWFFAPPTTTTDADAMPEVDASAGDESGTWLLSSSRCTNSDVLDVIA
jgi:hypothetical protein